MNVMAREVLILAENIASEPVGKRSMAPEVLCCDSLPMRTVSSASRQELRRGTSTVAVWPLNCCSTARGV